MEVILANAAYENIKNNKADATGLFYGMLSDRRITILGVAYNEEINAENVINMLPFMVDKIGTLVVHKGKFTLKDKGYHLIFDIDKQELILTQSPTKKIPYEIRDCQEIYNDFVTLNVRFVVDVSLDNDEYKIIKEFNCLKEKMLKSVYYFKCRSKCKEKETKIFSDDFEIEDEGNDFIVTVLESNTDLSQSFCTTFECKRKFSKKICLRLLIDGICLCIKGSKINKKVLLNSIFRFLNLFEDSFVEQVRADKSSFVLKSYHYWPSVLQHPLTVIYDEHDPETKCAEKRKKLHKLFNIPLDRPVFRKGNSTYFVESIKNKYPIMNVHENLKPSGVSGGRAVVLKGDYCYFHYSQNKFNDVGWGCAYRSLQTIVSWYIQQGYTTINVPDHREIQQCLVRIKDKPSSFVDSKQWIGSTEISYCLDEMIGVNCEICHLSARDELVTYGSKLEMHFASGCGPIMIGGGQLAHTIIGVHFDRETGDIKFLVLDPHYTGADDIRSIHSKGGVAWRPINFWDKCSFFNLCLPKKPSSVF